MGEDRPTEAIDDPASRGKSYLRVVDAQTYQDWEAVYRDNVVGIYHLAFRRVGNAPDAEDLSEEILLQALRRLRLPSPVHEVRSYLVKTARTVLAEHWRRHYAGRESEMNLDQIVVSSRASDAYSDGSSAT